MSAAGTIASAAAALLRRGRKIAGRAVNEAARTARKAMKRIRGARSRARVAAIHGRDRATQARGSIVRARRRVRRFRELQVEPLLQQRGIERELARLAHGNGPVIVGPWLSEVGYEVLYWVPFLRWFADRWGVRPERIVAVSRGGTAAWYDGVAGRYVEMLDLLAPSEFARRNEERRAAGDQKQLGRSALDDELVRLATESLGARDAHVCHPSLMFRLFRPFWFGNRTLDFFLRHTRYAPMRAPAPALALPTPYVAVKFYTGAALPDTPAHRESLRALIRGAARDAHIVSLDTGLALDEHQDYVFQDVPDVISIRGDVRPQDNLGVQTSVIAGAAMYLGTCGSLAWLAPMLGTPTVGVYADGRFLGPHLYTAPYVYRRMNAAPFTCVALHGLEAFARAPSLAGNS